MYNSNNTIVLSNGLTVKTFHSNVVHSVTTALFIPICCANIKNNEVGIFHFLEHMCFRKLHNHSQKEIYYYSERIGATLKGITYKDYIKFTITVLPKYFLEAFNIMFELLQEVTWDSCEIEAEKKVVKNQIRFQGNNTFEKKADRFYYKDTGYEFEIMGTESSVEAYSRKYINSMRNAVFSTQNSCFVFAGNYDKNILETAIMKMGLLPKTHNPIAIYARQPKGFCNRTKQDTKFLFTEYNIADVLISFDIPECCSLNKIAFLSGIIGEGYGSLLSVELRENLAITNEIYSYIQQFRCGSKIVIQCETTQNNVAKCVETIFSILNNVKREISEDIFLCSRVFYTENRFMLYDDTERLADWIGYKFIYPDQILSVNELIEHCQKITRDELIQSANDLFTGKNLFIATSCTGKKRREEIKEIVESWRDNKY